MSTVDQAEAVGERVVLRPFTREDVAAFDEAVRESWATLRQWMLWLPEQWSVEEAARRIDEWSERRPGGLADPLAIVARDDGALLGMVGLPNRREAHHATSLAYWVRDGASGHGYGTEAVGLALGLAFQRLGLRRVDAYVHPDNRPSRRLLHRLGFRLEGRLRSYFRLRGRYEDALLYGLLDEEWRGVASVVGGGVRSRGC